MVYLFEKRQRLLRYEIQDTDMPKVFAIVATHPDGFSRTEYVTGADALTSRWKAIERELHQAGWSGRPPGKGIDV